MLPSNNSCVFFDVRNAAAPGSNYMVALVNHPKSACMGHIRLCRRSHPFFIRLLPGGVEPSEVRSGAGGAEAALALPRTDRSSISSTLPALTRRSPAGRGERARLSCMQPIMTAMTAVSDATIPKAIVRISLMPREANDEAEAVPVNCDKKVAVGPMVRVRLVVAVGIIIVLQM